MQTQTLEITTPSDREIRMTRAFNAPRALVFDAWTKPELVQRWLGVRGGWTMPVCEIELREGGAYRFVWRSADREEMGVRGVYREIAPAERVVNTEMFDDAWYDGEALNALVLTEHGGRTIATTTLLYESQEIRNAVLRSNMEQGVGESYDALDGVLASMS